MQKQEKPLQYNEKKLKEVKIDLNNSFVSGSGASIEDIPNKYVSFILTENRTAMYSSYLKECEEDGECGQHMVSDSKIFNFYIDYIYCTRGVLYSSEEVRSWAAFFYAAFFDEEKRWEYKYKYYNDFDHNLDLPVGLKRCEAILM